MALNLPRLQNIIPVVNENRIPTTAFMQWWNTFAQQIELSITGIQDALDAAGIAQAAADAAQTAADAAATAATNAQNAADGATGLTSVVNSGVDISPLTATDAGSDVTINIAAHNRTYADGTTVAVSSGSLTGLAYTTTYFVYYDDPTRAGGSVTYVSTTTEADAAQVGDRHLVGKVLTPAAAAPDIDGEYIPVPGLDRLRL